VDRGRLSCLGREAVHLQNMRYIRLAAVLLLLACGDTPTSPPTTPTTPTTPTPVATSITLSATSLSFSSLGETSQLSATVKDQNGATMSGASVSWSSSSASVATVSSSGLVTSVADGTATITATSGSANGTAAVTVAMPASLELSDTLLTFSALADTTQLTATVKNAAGSTISGATVTWAVSDDAVATVSSAGLVTSVANGSATVTATSGEVSDTVAVTVAQVASTVELSPTTLSLTSIGDTATVTATVKDAAGSVVAGAAVTWATSAASVATVSSAGRVTSVADGTAVITATSGSVSATAAVTVVQVATSVTLAPTSLSFSSFADTTQLTATVKDANDSVISGATVTWATSAASVATVSSTGLVTSVADGTAVITATSGSVSATAAVTVTQGASSVTVSPTTVSFASLADTATLTATVKDSGGNVMSGVTVVWTTSTASVATVSSAGLVTSVADGTATVTATFGALAATTSATVAQVAASITLSPTTASFASLGDTATLTAAVKDANDSTMSGATVSWTTSAASVATVSSSGLVTSVADGTAVITATSGSVSATAAVTVVQVATSVTLAPTSLSFSSFADTTQLTATVKDANDSVISGATVTWATSAASVATVSSTGLVTSVADGTAVITATSGSVSATAAVTVTQGASSVTVSPTTVSFASLADTATLTATVKDSGGNVMSGATVTWASSDTTVATVSSAGLVTSVGNGTVTVTATSGSASGTAEITVNQGGATLDAITVTWTEGAAATITGSGFSATPASNTVTVDGLTASITSASTTELQITVPTAACKPSRVVDLVVTVASASATTTVGVKPETVWDLNLGGGVYTIGGDCLHLEAGTGSEEYMIGFFNSSESPSSLTPIKQTAIAGTTLAGDAAPDFPVASEGVGYIEAPMIAFGERPAVSPTPLQQVRRDPEYEAEMFAHAEAEARLREARGQTEEELASVGTDPQAMATAMEATIRRMPARSVGDTIPIRVWQSGNLCRDTTWAGYTGITEDISAVVRYIGTSAIYMEDTGNPLSESFTAAEYATWDATLSGTTMPTIKNYFGGFWDGIPAWGVSGDTLGLDADGRVGVVITKAVNKLAYLGFVNPYDLYATSSCNISNQSEVFYGHAPDPDGLYALGAKTKAEVAAQMPTLIAHEVTHILQGTQETYFGAANKSAWETEGGATLAEQLVGMAVLGHGSGQNLGKTEWLQGYYGDAWYKDWAADLRQYFGLESINSPEECTWLARDDDNDGPCWNGRAVYGVPATLLRFILDRYGPSYAGGEAALMRDLTNAAQIGYANLEARTGKSIGYLLTIFGIALWADGRGYNNSLTSWDLYPIMESWSGTDYKLQPHASSGTEPTAAISVRGGSTGYLRWSPPSSHAPTSLRIRTPDGDKLPDAMGFWILRIQ